MRWFRRFGSPRRRRPRRDPGCRWGCVRVAAWEPLCAVVQAGREADVSEEHKTWIIRDSRPRVHDPGCHGTAAIMTGPPVAASAVH